MIGIEESGRQEMETESKSEEIVYSSDKDFYKGMGGELRFKAEGLFKKAKEKGISIEDIDVAFIKENQAEFPGIGVIDLPSYMVKVKGKQIASGQVIIDGKQIDYYNRYQKYIAEKIERKNLVRDEKGKVVRENGVPKVKSNPELFLTEWERFDIGRSLVEDKEFGIEKTITGACDRVIRKLMGENDWLYPEEARLLDEEFNTVQERIVKEQEVKKQAVQGKKATDRQINYFKAKLKNSGLDPEDEVIKREVLKQSGFSSSDYNDLSTGEMSKMIDAAGTMIPKVKEILAKMNDIPAFNHASASSEERNVKQ